MGRQLILQGEIVKKHNQMVRARMRDLDTNLGHKILASLIAQIHKDDIDLNQTYEIEVKTFLPPGGQSYQNLKQIAENMVKCHVEFKKEKRVHLFLIFREISYGEGIIKARFNDDLREYLIGLQGYFTQINLIEFLMLSSVYSQRLFEILKSWESHPQKYVEIPLEELHKQLNTPEGQRKHFGLFKREILIKTHKEINKKTNLFFDWEPIKKGNGKTSPVLKIRFNFEKQKQKSILSLTKKDYKITPDQQDISKDNHKYGQEVHRCDYYKKRNTGEECLIMKPRTKKCILCNRIFKSRKSETEVSLFD